MRLSAAVTSELPLPTTWQWTCTVGTLSNSATQPGTATTSALPSPWWHPPATLFGTAGQRTGTISVTASRDDAEGTTHSADDSATVVVNDSRGA